MLVFSLGSGLALPVSTLYKRPEKGRKPVEAGKPTAIPVRSSPFVRGINVFGMNSEDVS